MLGWFIRIVSCNAHCCYNCHRLLSSHPNILFDQSLTKIRWLHFLPAFDPVPFRAWLEALSARRLRRQDTAPSLNWWAWSIWMWPGRNQINSCPLTAIWVFPAGRIDNTGRACLADVLCASLVDPVYHQNSSNLKETRWRWWGHHRDLGVLSSLRYALQCWQWLLHCPTRIHLGHWVVKRWEVTSCMGRPVFNIAMGSSSDVPHWYMCLVGAVC